MKLSTLVLATSMVIAPAMAFAQSSPAPANESGPGVSPTTQQPTDQGSGSETGNVKGTPSRGTMNRSPNADHMGTTGAGTTSGSRMNSPSTGSKPADANAK